MDIYTNFNRVTLTKVSTSSRSTKFNNILSWSISLMIMQTVPISNRTGISCGMKKGISLWVWRKVNENWDNVIRIFQWRGSHCRSTSTRKKKQIQKCQAVRVIVWDLSRKVFWVENSMSKENYDRICQFYQFHKNRLASPYDGH